MPQMKIDDIDLGHRYRKDMGDVGPLAASIKAVGLLHPVVVRPDGVLVSGARRIQACTLLGMTKVDVHVVKTVEDARLLLQAEWDENECRKPFTPSERVAIGLALEPLEKAEALKRQAAAGPTKGRGAKQTGSGKLPEPIKGESRDKVASAVGMSGKTYEKAKAVVEAAEEDPETYGPVRDEMDRTGKVDPAYKQVTASKEDGGNGKGRQASTSAGKGMMLAAKAIDVLKKIPKQDPLRAAGLDEVLRWIKHNR